MIRGASVNFNRFRCDSGSGLAGPLSGLWFRSDRGTSGDEPAGNGQLVREPGEGRAGGFLTDAAKLVKNGARLDDCGPVFDFALTLTHAGFSRDRGNALVREDPDVELAAPLDRLAGDDAPGLDRGGGDLARFQRLEPVLAEGDVGAP